MGRCPACGAELSENMRYCPHCGHPLEESEKLPARDFWAEQLSAVESSEEDQDWTQEIEDEDLPDLDEDVPWTGPELDVQPPDNKKRVWAVVLLASLLAVLCVCFGIFSRVRKAHLDVPGAGMYYGVYCMIGENMEPAEDDWAELVSDGSFHMSVLQGYAGGSWKLTGDDFYANTDCGEIKGTIKDGVLSFRWRKVTYVLALPGHEEQVSIPQKTGIDPTFPTEHSKYLDWNGEYYGCMLLQDGTGCWENIRETWDVCGRIEVLENDLGSVSLWSPANKPGERFCIADVLFKEGTTEKGLMQLEWGMFLDMEMSPGAWVVDPGKSIVSYLPQMLCIRGRFKMPSDPISTFEYLIFLRPWGEKWEDIEKMDESQLPCSDILPPGYSRWYLPLVEAGMHMPDHF